MKRLLLTAIVISFTAIITKSQTEGVMEYKPIPIYSNSSVRLKEFETSSKPFTQTTVTYSGKFTLGTDQRWHPDNFLLIIGEDQIHYKKDGITKSFDAVNKGVYTRQETGIAFKYQQFYLSSKGMHMLISHKKEIKHNGIFYYRIIIDGQTQLAL